ncbi:hypothetical protein V6N11_053547 [Hibiscus sabdariffa]|uniref:Uncharacterized protein n=1 Tax=Hibiscus sabdariffa TaxID=183260 RepID=A0ABR2UDE1_9ROSI
MNVGWEWGFGIPSAAMAISIIFFIAGSRTYRLQKPGGSPLTRICQVIVASFRKLNVKVPADQSFLYETDGNESIRGSRKLEHTDKLNAGILEVVRLRIVQKNNYYDLESIPMSIFWQVPGYFLVGCAEVFTFIGQIEFFYDQAPDAMRSLCSALSLTTVALGNYLSTVLVTAVTKITTQDGKLGWIPDNLNMGHLDYFFWLLAILSLLNFIVYLWIARWYTYKKHGFTGYDVSSLSLLHFKPCLGNQAPIIVFINIRCSEATEVCSLRLSSASTNRPNGPNASCSAAPLPVLQFKDASDKPNAFSRALLSISNSATISNRVAQSTSTGTTDPTWSFTCLNFCRR